MRRLKANPNDMKQLIADAIEQLQAGAKKITLNIEDLLTLPAVEHNDRPRVIITEDAYNKMKALVDNHTIEIAWHGIVSRLEIDKFIIEDILVYPQTASATTVESDDDLYPLWLDELDDNDFNNIRMQGHSHVNMGVTPSAVDTDFYETLIQHISDYYIFLIMNKKGAIWINLYDIGENVVYETKDINLIIEGFDYASWAEDQYDEDVHRR